VASRPESFRRVLGSATAREIPLANVCHIRGNEVHPLQVLVDNLPINLHIHVSQHIPEAREGAELTSELSRQNANLAQFEDSFSATANPGTVHLAQDSMCQVDASLRGRLKPPLRD
jgi:hypothetical protein